MIYPTYTLQSGQTLISIRIIARTAKYVKIGTVAEGDDVLQSTELIDPYNIQIIPIDFYFEKNTVIYISGLMQDSDYFLEIKDPI